MPNVKGGYHRLWKRKPVARDRVWQAMRILRRFTIPDLEATAETGYDNAKRYVNGLMKSGYLSVAREKQEGKKGGHRVLQLVRDTGPRAPRLQTDGNTYDPNEHKIYQGGLTQ